MKHKIGIIGIHGVGKAHAIALLPDQELSFISDVDLTRVFSGDRAARQLVNKWGTIHERAMVPSHVPLIHVNDLTASDTLYATDLCIIATPDNTHRDIYFFLRRAGYEGFILVEKPLKFGEHERLKDPKLAVGFEWLYHPVIDSELTERYPTHIAHFHAYPPTREWDSSIVEDLGSHLLAYVVSSYDDYDPDRYSIDVTYLDEDHAVFEVVHRSTRVQCVAAYMKQGFRTRVFNMLVPSDPKEGELILNDTLYKWRDDLFTIQMKSILSGDNRAPYELGACVDELLNSL